MQRFIPDPLPLNVTHLPLFVSYGETDRGQVVYHAEYLHWFERARGAYIRKRGMSYREVEERGIILPVRQCGLRYLRPARYDDHVVITTGVVAVGRASMDFSYVVRLADAAPDDPAAILCTGQTEHAVTGPDGKPVRIPDWLAELCCAPERDDIA